MGPNSSGDSARVRSAGAGKTSGRPLRGTRRRRRRVRSPLVVLLGAVVVLVTAGAALAFSGLPSGGHVNDDLAAGINKAISVSGEEPTNADVVGGALTAGAPAVPWAIFRQQETNAAPPPDDQVFSRSFAGGKWTTRGTGTVGGRSSASPTFTGSLELQPGAGRGGAVDRFRGRGPDRAVGELV